MPSANARVHQDMPAAPRISCRPTPCFTPHTLRNTPHTTPHITQHTILSTPPSTSQPGPLSAPLPHYCLQPPPPVPALHTPLHVPLFRAPLPTLHTPSCLFPQPSQSQPLHPPLSPPQAKVRISGTDWQCRPSGGVGPLSCVLGYPPHRRVRAILGGGNHQGGLGVLAAKAAHSRAARCQYSPWAHRNPVDLHSTQRILTLTRRRQLGTTPS